MLFNSWTFFLFFPIVTSIYFLTPFNKRWMVLLVASCAFYMAFVPVYILILAATIVIDYIAAIKIYQSAGSHKFRWLILSIVFTCLILFFFKYYDFFAWNFNYISKYVGSDITIKVLNIILPIGLSFHTFQSLSYVIEVYRGNQKPERHFGIYALYVMFYPQLVAGPIERPQNLLHQFHESHKFNYEQAVSGLRLMAWGLFKKAVIADRLAQFVSPVYDHPQNFNGGILIIATLFFTFQIFCDFSGYSDMARGAARVMGFRLMLNFDRPYSATSLSEFWRRWHISLSTWLRDYIFEPVSLGLRDFRMYGVVIALMVTFLISGFWHGANWTFVIWGLLHGLGLSAEAFSTKQRKKLSKVMPKWLFNLTFLTITFSFVNFSYIFFRSKTISDATLIIHHIFSWIHHIDFNSLKCVYEVIPKHEFLLCLVQIFILFLCHVASSKIDIDRKLTDSPWWIRWTVYQIGLLAIILGGVWMRSQSFIYFQF